MSLILNIPEFWIYKGSEYASGFEYARILNIPNFWIYQSYTGFGICLNNSWICLNMPDYVSICLNISEYAELRVNEHGAIFLKRQKLIFSVADGSISFVFCFRLNIFTSKIWICCYLSGLTGRKWCWGSWILIYPSSVLFFLSQNWYRNPYDPIFVK